MLSKSTTTPISGSSGANHRPEQLKQLSHVPGDLHRKAASASLDAIPLPPRPSAAVLDRAGDGTDVMSPPLDLVSRREPVVDEKEGTEGTLSAVLVHEELRLHAARRGRRGSCSLPGFSPSTCAADLEAAVKAHDIADRGGKAAAVLLMLAFSLFATQMRMVAGCFFGSPGPRLVYSIHSNVGNTYEGISNMSLLFPNVCDATLLSRNVVHDDGSGGFTTTDLDASAYAANTFELSIAPGLFWFPSTVVDCSVCHFDSVVPAAPGQEGAQVTVAAAWWSGAGSVREDAVRPVRGGAVLPVHVDAILPVLSSRLSSSQQQELVDAHDIIGHAEAFSAFANFIDCAMTSIGFRFHLPRSWIMGVLSVFRSIVPEAQETNRDAMPLNTDKTAVNEQTAARITAVQGEDTGAAWNTSYTEVTLASVDTRQDMAGKRSSMDGGVGFQEQTVIPNLAAIVPVDHSLTLFATNPSRQLAVFRLINDIVDLKMKTKFEIAVVLKNARITEFEVGWLFKQLNDSVDQIVERRNDLEYRIKPSSEPCPGVINTETTLASVGTRQDLQAKDSDMDGGEGVQEKTGIPNLATDVSINPRLVLCATNTSLNSPDVECFENMPSAKIANLANSHEEKPMTVVGSDFAFLGDFQRRMRAPAAVLSIATNVSVDLFLLAGAQALLAASEASFAASQLLTVVPIFSAVACSIVLSNVGAFVGLLAVLTSRRFAGAGSLERGTKSGFGAERWRRAALFVLAACSLSICDAATTTVTTSALQTTLNSAAVGVTIILTADSIFTLSSPSALASCTGADVALFCTTKAVNIRCLDVNKMCTLDGAGAGRVSFISTGTSSTTTLQGLILQGGNPNEGGTCWGARPNGGLGGGMRISASVVSIADTSFLNNFSAGSGSGLYVGLSSTVFLTSVLFSGNSAFNCGYYGGGMCVSSSTATLTSCTFDGNTVSGTNNGQGAFGGGMYISESTVYVSLCVFKNNISKRDADGGGAYGGAIYVTSSSNLSISSSSFTLNSAEGVRFSAAGSGANDIYNNGATVTVNGSTTCSQAGHTPSAAIKGSALATAGAVSGSPFSYTCAVCAAGSYRSSGLSSCTACEAGKYLSDAATLASLHDEATDCTTCDVGKVSPPGVAACSATCDPGRYASSQSCLDCAAGSYSATAGISPCLSCDVGKYSPPGTVACSSACDPGRYVSSKACLVCVAGTYSSTSGISASCQSCLAGKYLSDAATLASLHDDAADCTTCDVGKYSPPGMAACSSACDPGRFVSFQACIICVAGSFSSTSGTPASCQSCLAGKFLSDTATLASLHDDASDCTVCAAGKYSATVAASTCSDCPAGTSLADAASLSSAHDALTDCAVCDAGTYSATAGAAICSSCAAGKYLGDFATDYAKHDAESDCVTCGLGRYSPTGASSCSSTCDPGRYASFQSCLICGSGTYFETADIAASCTACSAGKHLSDVGTLASLHDLETDCTDCDVGTYSSSPASASCTVCLAGTYSTAGSSRCTSCLAGKYSNSASGGTSSDICVSCVEGKANPSDGAVLASACLVCAKGKFSPIPASTTCDDCPMGTYNVRQQSSSCLDCSFGKYNSQLGSDYEGLCLPCLPGRFGNVAGLATSCYACQAGKIAPSSGYAECVDCTPGTFSSETESVKCASCEKGQFSSVSGALSCTSCETGKYTASAGSSTCTFCAGGFYLDSSTSSCVECSVGTFSNPASIFCDPCDDTKGYVSKTVGARNACAYCGPGSYADNLRGLCADCPVNTYSIGGVSKCKDCEVGKFNSVQASSSCSACSRGTFPSDGACVKCGIGAVSESGISCVSCNSSSGFVAPGEGMTQCVYCGPGKAAHSSSQTCRDCEPNSFSVGGSNYCALCSNGAHSVGGSSSCSTCAPGRYYDAASSTTSDQCTACAAGKFSSTGAQTIDGCEFCDQGTVSDEGSGFCSPCEPGKIPSSKDRSVCLTCTPGKFASFGVTFCSDCALGAFSNEGAGYCSPCPQYQHADPENAFKCSCNEGFVPDPQRPGTCTCHPGKTLIGTTCSACEGGKFKANYGVQSCDICDLEYIEGAFESVVNMERTTTLSCACGVSLFFHKQSIASKPKLIGSCEKCPIGTLCEKTGITVETLPVMRGYWRSSFTSINFERCHNFEACRQPSLNWTITTAFNIAVNDQCEVGYEGPICNVCKINYERTATGFCQVCESTTIPTNTILVGVAILFSFVLILLYVKKVQSGLTGSVSSAGAPTHRGLERAHTSKRFEEEIPFYEKFRTKFKIFASFFQIVSQFESILRVRFPASFERFGRIVSSIFNLDFLNVASFDCIVRVNFYDKLVFTTVAPILFSVFIALCTLFLMCVTKSKEARASIVDSAMGMFLTLTYLVFASVSTIVFNTFNCESYSDDKRMYLASDQSIDCGTESHKKYKQFAMCMIAIYPVGIPLLYFVLLFRNRDVLSESSDRRMQKQSLRKTSFLWIAYEPRMWFFEVIDCFRRLMLTGILVFIFRGKASQIVFAMVVAAFSVVIFVHLKPYAKHDDDKIAIVSQVAIFFTLFGALLKKVKVDEDDEYDQASFGLLLIAINCTGLCFSATGGAVGVVAAATNYLMQKHVHESPLKGLTADHWEKSEFMVYFKRLAKSDTSEAGWEKVKSVEWGGNVDETRAWLEETGAVAEWRCSVGYGIIDQSRVRYEVDISLEDVTKFVMLLGPKKCEMHPMTVEMFRVNEVDKNFDQIYAAFTMPFPLSCRDYLTERFVEKSETEVFLAFRSFEDESLYPLKKSGGQGRIRGRQDIGGYWLKSLGPKRTSVTYLNSGSINGWIGKIGLVLKIAAVTQFRDAVETHRKYADVVNGKGDGRTSLTDVFCVDIDVDSGLAIKRMTSAGENGEESGDKGEGIELQTVTRENPMVAKRRQLEGKGRT